MSPFFCTKDESLDWTEITKSGTRQNQKNKPKTRQKFQLYYHFFFMYLTCHTGDTIADFLFWKNQNK